MIDQATNTVTATTLSVNLHNVYGVATRRGYSRSVALVSGQIFAGCTIIRLLGSGGMGDPPDAVERESDQAVKGAAARSARRS